MNYLRRYGKKYFEITWISLWRILAFVLAITGLYLIREILILLALAILISSVCQPWVDFLQKKKVSRFFGNIFCLYFDLDNFGSIFLAGCSFGRSSIRKFHH